MPNPHSVLRERWDYVSGLDIGDDSEDEVADRIMAGGKDSKTLAYVAITQLLGKIADPERDILSLSDQDPATRGAWVPRKFAKDVIVPWEQELGGSCLGGSLDPYVSKPARGDRLQANPHRTRNREGWAELHGFLTPLNDCDQEERIAALDRLLLALRRKRDQWRSRLFS